MTRFFRLLLFLAFAGAAAGMVLGFFVMDWREPTAASNITVGHEFVQLAVDQLKSLLQLQNTELSLDLLRNSSSEIQAILRENWPSIGVYYIIFLIPTYAIQTIGAFVALLVARPFYPYGAFGRFFAFVGMTLSTIFALIVPLFILSRFYDAYLANQTIAAGFWVTGGAVILGAVAHIIVDLIRYFVPHPMATSRAPRKKKDETFGSIPAGYFDEGGQPIYDPYRATNPPPQDNDLSARDKKGQTR